MVLGGFLFIFVNRYVDMKNHRGAFLPYRPVYKMVAGHIHEYLCLSQACQMLTTGQKRVARLEPVEHGW